MNAISCGWGPQDVVDAFKLAQITDALEDVKKASEESEAYIQKFIQAVSAIQAKFDKETCGSEFEHLDLQGAQRSLQRLTEDKEICSMDNNKMEDLMTPIGEYEMRRNTFLRICHEMSSKRRHPRAMR
jgi:hypothetical protein